MATSTDEAAIKESVVLTFLARLLRSIRGLSSERQRKVIGLLSRLARNPGIRFPVGEFSFVIDWRHICHPEMVVGTYEFENVRALRAALRPGDAYVDVGAEIGYMAARAAGAVGSTGRLVLFEPDPRIFPRLQAHMTSAPAGKAPALELTNRACSDADREFEFELAPESGQSQVVQWDRTDLDRATTTVRSVVADEELKRLGVDHIRVLKMDVEGHEIPALRGLVRAFEERRIDFFFVEKNNILLPKNDYLADHLCAFAMHYGYVGVLEGGAPISRERLDDRGEYWLDNFIFARDLEHLRRIYPDACPDKGAPLDVERLWREAMDPTHPGREMEALKERVRQGDVAGGVDAGLALLDRRPDLIEFRGHVAHWLRVVGRTAEARDQYERILAENPENAEVASILSELAAGSEASA